MPAGVVSTLPFCPMTNRLRSSQQDRRTGSTRPTGADRLSPNRLVRYSEKGTSMFRKVLILSLAVVAVSAIAAPSAFANWSYEGAAVTQNQLVELHGTLEVAGAGGRITCNDMNAEMELIAESNNAAFGSFQSEAPREQCEDAGAFFYGCGTGNGVVSALVPEGLVATPNKSGVFQLTKFNWITELLHCSFSWRNVKESGKEIPIILTPNNTWAINSYTLEGLVTFNGTTQMAIHGHFEMTPGGVYGV